MIKYRGSRLARSGLIGVVLIVMIIAIGLQPERLLGWATAIRYEAVFTEAGGLTTGNGVKISGVKVGDVTGVRLERGRAVVSFTVRSQVTLGDQTTAHIRTSTLLGERQMTLNPSGDTPIRSGGTIPASRTSSPYSLTEAVGELTANTAGTDTGSLNQSLDTLAETIDQVTPQLGPAFDGLSRLSASLNDRNAHIGELLRNADDVSGILAARSNEVNTLILNANDLVGVLADRRQAIASLLADTSALAQQLSGVIADNEAELAPTLELLNGVIDILQRNRDNIGKALPGLSKYQSELSEIVASGPYYTAYVPNVIPSQLLQPFMDYAFGLKPRARLPLPYNGIPQGPS